MITIGFVSMLDGDKLLKFEDSEASAFKLILINEIDFNKSRKDDLELKPGDDRCAFVVQHANSSEDEKQRQISWLEEEGWKVTIGPTFSHTEQHHFWTSVRDLLSAREEENKNEVWKLVKQITEMYEQAEALKRLDVFVAYKILAEFEHADQAEAEAEAYNAGDAAKNFVAAWDQMEVIAEEHDLAKLLDAANEVALKLITSAEPTDSTLEGRSSVRSRES